MKGTSGLNTRTVARLALLVVGASLPFWVDSSWVTTAVFVLVAAIGVTGLNVLTGFAGQVSLGHAFFMACGAYSYVHLAEALSEPVVAVVAAAFIAAAAGALTGPIALRVKGLYLAVMTLGLCFIGQHILFNVESLSGGPAGRDFPGLSVGDFSLTTQTLNLGPFVIDPNALHYYLFALVLVAATWFCSNLSRSRSGRSMFAIRERPDVAESIGVQLARTKVAAFTISAFFGGLGGALFVAYVGYAQPGQWDLHLSVQYVAALIVGGMGSTAGPLLGAAVVFGLPTLLTRVAEAVGAEAPTAAMTSALYGALIVLFLMFEPRGAVGVGERLLGLGQRIAPRSGRPSKSGEKTQHQPPATPISEEAR